MKKFKVTIPFPVFITVSCEADSEEDAIEIAHNEAGLTAFAGNGGIDKIVGVTEPNQSIDVGDCFIEGCGFSIDVEEV